ncbi:unnamed protein product [Amoebophrya sp. A25]|nr:unnamed protein product [Amoebophrya sp. A25]|eukprot:GSA25T00004251001.1
MPFYDFLQNSAAAGVSVASTVALFNPLDTLKVRWQVTGSAVASSSSVAAVSSKIAPTTMLSFAQQILKQEGFWRGLHRPGLVPNAGAMGLASATRMGLYPYFRDGLVALAGAEEKNAGIMFVGGLIPGFIGYVLVSPVYQAKNRMQAEAGLLDPASGLLLSGARAGKPPEYREKTLYCLRCIAAEGNLYRASAAMGFRGAALTAGQMLGYDGCKTYTRRMEPLACWLGLLKEDKKVATPMPDTENGHDSSSGAAPKICSETPLLHLLASLAGALFATLSCMPFDNVMVRYQTKREKYCGSVSDCVRTVAKEEGVRGFYRGGSPLFIRFAIVFGIYMPVYEQIRAEIFSMGYSN